MICKGIEIKQWNHYNNIEYKRCNTCLNVKVDKELFWFYQKNYKNIERDVDSYCRECSQIFKKRDRKAHKRKNK